MESVVALLKKSQVLEANKILRNFKADEERHQIEDCCCYSFCFGPDCDIFHFWFSEKNLHYRFAVHPQFTVFALSDHEQTWYHKYRIE